MSAEFARNGPETSGTDHAARVFPFRRSRRREATMPHPPHPDRPGDLSPQEKLTAWIEKAFADHQRTLTDPDTAEAFLISLALMRTVLDGARAQQLIDDAAHADLIGMLDGMQAAPRLLAP